MPMNAFSVRVTYRVQPGRPASPSQAQRAASRLNGARVSFVDINKINRISSRWTVSVSKETDIAVRSFLARRGLRKGDLSKLIEEAVTRVAPSTVAAGWPAENEAAIRAHNARVEAEGPFGDDHRLF